jgi:hypothetical protein
MPPKGPQTMVETILLWSVKPGMSLVANDSEIKEPSRLKPTFIVFQGCVPL